VWKRSLTIFLSISLAATLVVLGITVSPTTYQALSRLKPICLFFAFGLWVGYLSFDALRLKTILSALGAQANFLSSARLLLVGIFMAAITPFGAGGLPVQLYLLNRDGVSPGQGGAALLLRAILTGCFLAIALPLIIGLASWTLKPGLIRAVLYYLAGLYSLFLVLFLLLIFKPTTIRALSVRVVRLFGHRSNLSEKVGQEMDRFRDALLGFFGFGPKVVIFGLALTAASALIFLLIAPALLYGLGVEAPIIQVLILQVVLVFVVTFAPSPGGAGIAEAGSAALYSLICPFYLVGVYTVLWRFFSCYLGAGLGGLSLLGFLRRRELDGLIHHKVDKRV
jgi:hypothetical protein